MNIMRRDTPELVIAEVRMPSMNGDEFVRRIRSDPRARATPVIFSTAVEQEEEARALAEHCGVTHLRALPSDPIKVLRTVAEVLGPGRRNDDSEATVEVETDVLRDLNGALLEKVRTLEVTNHRLIELNDLGRSMGLERNSDRLIAQYCRSGASCSASGRSSSQCWKRMVRRSDTF